MNFCHCKNTTSDCRSQKGRNLILESVIFIVVYAVCYLGNILIMVGLLDCFYIPHFNKLIEFENISNQNEILAHVMSLPFFPVIMLFSTVATILVVIIFCRLIQRRSWHSMGLLRQDAILHYIRGFICGIIAISIAVGMCIIAGAGLFINGDRASAYLIFLFLLAYLIQGASEEILCRGYFMYSVARRYPMWVAVIVSSLFFAWLHLPNDGISAMAFLNLFLFGVFAALLTIRTGSIWCASGFHSAWNFVQGNLFGIKVSGMDMHSSLLHYVPNASKSWLDGGDFGVEGGILSTLILTTGIVAVLLQIRRDRKKAEK